MHIAFTPVEPRTPGFLGRVTGAVGEVIGLRESSTRKPSTPSPPEVGRSGGGGGGGGGGGDGGAAEKLRAAFPAEAAHADAVLGAEPPRPER